MKELGQAVKKSGPVENADAKFAELKKLKLVLKTVKLLKQYKVLVTGQKKIQVKQVLL